MKQPILVQPLEIRSIWYYTATESHLSADKFSMFTSTHHWHTCRTCKSSQDQWKTARNTSAATLLRSNCTYNLRLQWYKMFQRRLESKNKQGNVNAGCDNVQAKNATNARLHSVCLPTLLFKRNATERHIVHG